MIEAIDIDVSEKITDLSKFIQESFGSNATYVEGLLARYKTDPALVDDAWQAYFGDLLNGDVPAEAILNAQLEVSVTGGALVFAPMVDGKTVPVNPLEAVANGAARDIEIIIGSNRDEAKLFNALAPREPIDDEKLIVRVQRLLPSITTEKAL